MKFKTFALALTSAALLAGMVRAQPPVDAPPPPAPRPAPGPLTVHPLADGVSWVSGGIGNAGWVAGPTGTVVVDTTISPVPGAKLIRDVAAAGAKPVVAVIVTHGDTDHAGGLSAFPPGTPVYAQQATVARLKRPLAIHAVDREEGATLGGLDVRLLHWAPAHTAGDLVAFFPKLRLVFTGDIFAMDQPGPLIHREQGGTSAGWIASARGIVALDADRFVVGHGAVQTKAALVERLRKAELEIGQVTALVAQGKSLAEVEDAVGDRPAPVTNARGKPRFTPFAQVLFEEQTGHD